MRTLTLKSATLSFISVVMLALLSLLPVLNSSLQGAQVWLAGDTASRAQRSQADQGGQTASPNPSSGFDQEERVRQMLSQQYEQRFGTSDNTIRSALNLRGKVADFVGYNAKQNRWLIAESKGGNLGDAYDQIANTTRGLLSKFPRARVELRIYVSADQLAFLREGGNFGGYYVDAQNYLRALNDLREWEYAIVEGVKILLRASP